MTSSIVHPCCLLALLTPLAWTTGAAAETLALRGIVGVTNNWALNITLHKAEEIEGAQSYSGTMLLRHIGLCSVDGKELKTGTASASVGRNSMYRLVLTFENEQCTLPGPVQLGPDATHAFMRCHNGFQVPLNIWKDP